MSNPSSYALCNVALLVIDRKSPDGDVTKAAELAYKPHDAPWSGQKGTVRVVPATVPRVDENGFPAVSREFMETFLEFWNSETYSSVLPLLSAGCRVRLRTSLQYYACERNDN